MTTPSSDDERQKTWDFDIETLDQAWKDYRNLPLADKQRQRFGQYFLNRFKIPSLISWPALFYEQNPVLAYLMLFDLSETVRHTPPRR